MVVLLDEEERKEGSKGEMTPRSGSWYKLHTIELLDISAAGVQVLLWEMV
jgi:hypothetical protein